MEQGKYQTLDAELQQREASWEKQRQHEAAIRVEKEHTLIKNSEKKRRQQEKYASLVEETIVLVILRENSFHVLPSSSKFAVHRKFV